MMGGNIMTNVEIKPITDGISFIEYLGQIFTTHGEDFGKMLCENKLSIETERTLTFKLIDGFGNERELEITLRDLD